MLHHTCDTQEMNQSDKTNRDMTLYTGSGIQTDEDLKNAEFNLTLTYDVILEFLQHLNLWYRNTNSQRAVVTTAVFLKASAQYYTKLLL